MEDKKNILPIAAGIIYSTIFGFSFMFTKKALDIISPFHLLGYRFLAAAIVLTLLQIFGVIKISFKGKRYHMLFLLGLFQPVSYFIFETIGIKLTSSSEAGMMIAIIPIFVTILATIFLKEKPSKSQWFFIVISVLGVIFINAMKGSLELESSILGIFILLGAVVSAGFFNILSRKLSLQFKPVELTFAMMWIGTIVFNSISILNHINNGNIKEYFTPLFNPNVLWAIMYLGILSSVIAFFMVNFMLSKIEASKSSVFANLTTIVSIIAGVVILKEDFYWFHFIGGLMILLGVWGTNSFKRGKETGKSLIK